MGRPSVCQIDARAWFDVRYSLDFIIHDGVNGAPPIGVKLAGCCCRRAAQGVDTVKLVPFFLFFVVSSIIHRVVGICEGDDESP
jgi:hypothetical protein